MSIDVGVDFIAEMDNVRKKLEGLPPIGKPHFYSVNQRVHHLIVSNNTSEYNIEYHKWLDTFTLNGVPLHINNNLEDGIKVHTPQVNDKPVDLYSRSTEFKPLRYEVADMRLPMRSYIIPPIQISIP